jgi:hypothetical protein
MTSPAVARASSVSPKNRNTRCRARIASFALTFTIAGAAGLFPPFAQAGTFPAVVDLRSLDGTNGFVVQGVTPGDGTGSSVSSAGDFNGDGITDIIIGAGRSSAK